MTGYSHRLYAASLAEFGEPLELPSCGGWVLTRSVPGATHRDGMGCYPLFCCRDWRNLPADLRSIEREMVCLSLVTDPFGNYTALLLHSLFDVVQPFKLHFIADLSQPVNELAPKYHRKHARKALREVQLTVSGEPQVHLEAWCELYRTLVTRHKITGLRAFSRQAFALHLQLPGMVIFLATRDGQPVGAHLWLVQGDVAYSHLSAYSEQGYELRVSYALNWAANEYFAGRVRVLHLGAGAGLSADENDGLTAFKRGWATSTKPVFLCGKVFDRAAYDRLTEATGKSGTNYFPAYREGEFV